MKRCTIDHDALKNDLERWSKLTLIGIQPDITDAQKYPPLELRNCSCGSTLARVMDTAEETPTP